MMNSSNNFGRKALFAAMSAMALSVCGNVFAASPQTANLAVSADVIDNCLISTGALAFGDYDPVGANKAANKTGTGTVTVTCTTGAAGLITLNQGANSISGSGEAPARRLSDGTNFLNYGLFTEGTWTTVWGYAASTDVSITGDGEAEELTVYGQIGMNQNKPAGAYTDTVVASVSF